VTTLYEELQPLAAEVEGARDAVVEAARGWCGGGGKAGEEEQLREAVKKLDEAQMALGLKTARLLLTKPFELVEALKGEPESLPDKYATSGPFANTEPPPAPPHPPSSIGPWGKKRDE
jgi:hypothetical protein